VDARHASDFRGFDDVPKFRTSWDGLRYDGEYRDHRFNAAFYAAAPGSEQGYWLMWYYWPGMPVDYDGFAIHPATAPNGRPCTGYYPTLADVRAAIGAILASIDNPNVVAFRPKAFETPRPSKQTDGPLVA
jgi:hypothetical protein